MCQDAVVVTRTATACSVSRLSACSPWRRQVPAVHTDLPLPEEVRPREVLNGLLFCIDRPVDNLCVQMLRENRQKTGFYRERLVEKSLVEIFLHLLRQYHRHSLVIILRPPCSPDHLYK